MSVAGRLRALAQRDLRWVVCSTLVSELGDGVTRVALAFAVLDLTGSVADLGIVIASQTVSQVAVLLVGGVVADRSNRRALMMAADLVRFGSQAAIGLLLLTHHANVAEMAVSQAIVGLGSGFFDPASNGLLGAVAGEHLQEGNAMQGIARSASSIVGPAIGGVLVVAIGPSWALLLDGASYALSALFLSLVSAAAGSAHRTVDEPSASFLSELRGGFHEVAGRTWVWATILAFSVSNSLSTSWNVLGPALCKRHYGGAAAFALVTTVWGIGSLLGGLLLLVLKPRRPLLVGTLICLPTMLTSLLAALLAPLWLLVAAALVGGLGPTVFNTLWWTALQEHVPKRAISRVIAYDYAGSYALQPLGQALAGPLALAVGLQPALLVFALGSGVAVAVSLLIPSVRNLSTPEPETDIVVS